MSFLEKYRYMSIKGAVIGLYILYNIMPIIPRIISSTVTTYAYMSLIVFIVLFVMSAGFNYYLSFILPFAMFELLFMMTSNNSISLRTYQFILFLMPVLLGVYILRDYRHKISSFAKLVISAFGITALTTFMGLIQYPNASRVLATIDSSQNEYAIIYSWHNMGGYDLVYMIVLLYPLLILAYKKSIVKFPFALTGAAGILIFLVSASYTTALLLFAISSVLFFMSKKFKVRNLVLLTIIAILVILLFQDKVNTILIWVSQRIGSDDIAKRLALMAGGINAINQSDDNRLLLYQQSINLFLHHPVFGGFLYGDTSVGGHSFILDTIGRFGIIGIGLLFIMYKRIYRFFYSVYSKADEFGYILWMFLQALILSCLNTGMWLIVLCFFAPLILDAMMFRDDNYEE